MAKSRTYIVAPRDFVRKRGDEARVVITSFKVRAPSRQKAIEKYESKAREIYGARVPKKPLGPILNKRFSDRGVIVSRQKFKSISSKVKETDRKVLEPRIKRLLRNAPKRPKRKKKKRSFLSIFNF